MAEKAMTDAAAAAPKRENIWLNIGLNVIIPSLLMSKGKKWLGGIEGIPESWLEPQPILVLALSFPVCYGIYDFIARKKYNFFSVLGFVSILISGGVGLLELDKDWVAVKEAAIPALFAIAVLVSLKTPFPLIRTFLYSPEIFNVPKIESALRKRGYQQPFEQLMARCTYYLAGSFVMSAVLNYAVAKYFIRSETGTTEFNEQLGRMTFWSWPIIAVPSMVVMTFILMKLVKGIEKYTGYEMEDVLLIGASGKANQATETRTLQSEEDGH